MSRDELDALLEGMVPGSGATHTTDVDAPPLPSDLDLEPRGVLGRGAMGWVFRAYDPVLDLEVAVKVSRPEVGRAARDALLAEARTTARLAHPAVLPVHRVVVRDGLLCVVFQLAPERTLEALLSVWRTRPKAAWSLPNRLLLLRTVTDAVAHAHQLQVVHGDLKPSNITVGPGGLPIVLDWAGLHPSGDGTFSGTPEYAAPEQLMGQPVGPPSDVFALGALAWELVVLRPMRARQRGETVGAYIASQATAPPPDMTEIAATHPELAVLIGAALGQAPDARPSAGDLRQTLDAMLSGRVEAERRHRQAEAHMAQAREAFLRFEERERRLTEEKHVVELLRTKIPPWSPARDKQPLWAAQARAAQLLDAQAESWTTAIETAHEAVSLQPDSASAHRLLADLWWRRMQMAEVHGYVGERQLAEARVRQHDQGRYAATLDATSRLTLAGEALQGGQVTLTPVVEDGPVLGVGVSRTLQLPLVDHELTPGSWLANLKMPDGRAANVPLWVRRLDHLELSPTPRSAVEVGDGWCLVPAGPFRMGGDLGARLPVEACMPWVEELFVRRSCVTSAEYLEFLRQLPPEQAALRVPATALPRGQPVSLWPSLAMPVGWQPTLPVVGLRLEDAQAFAAWSSERTGRAVRLPTEEEWEKAARGADGRVHPWGPLFDPSFCHMRDSLPGSPTLATVASVATDRSPYGVRDVAGGVREWTRTTVTGGRVVVRGGSWADGAQACRLASRETVVADQRSDRVGFRLVSEVPAS